MRFGLFWRTLKLDLKNAGDIINAAALLHNFIVDERERERERTVCVMTMTHLFSTTSRFRQFHIWMDPASRVFTDPGREIPNPVATDNNVPNRGGRCPSSVSVTSNKEEGRQIRELVKIHFKSAWHEETYAERIQGE